MTVDDITFPLVIDCSIFYSLIFLVDKFLPTSDGAPRLAPKVHYNLLWASPWRLKFCQKYACNYLIFILIFKCTCLREFILTF